MGKGCNGCIYICNSINKYPCKACDGEYSKWSDGNEEHKIKYKINPLIILCLILFISNFVVANGFVAELQDQDKIIAQLQTQPQQSNRITITEPMTLIRNTEDYIYLNSLEIDKDTLEHATKHTDINGVTWYEVIDDGYIKVYAEGHVMPDGIHWYAPY